MSLLRRKQTGPVKRDPTEAVPDERIFGRHYRGPSPAKIGLAVAILASLIPYYARQAFTKHFPFTSRGYELHATFRERDHAEAQLAGADRRRQRGRR